MEADQPVSSQQRDPVLETFLGAIDLPDGDRTAFLREACDNTAMRAEVEALLAYDESFDPQRIDSAIQAVAGTLARDESWIGRHLGAYRITGQIGEGGMGAVFLAERADARFEKKVAIKLVTRGLDSAAIRQRLVEERRILANLDHPYIAKLMDGGETAEGVPYLVMEYVDGLPLLAFSQKLPLKERVKLACRICEAVAFAHRNLVVHRDLKPSNILVAEDGTPKLLDFGIAGALNSAEQAVVAFTPQYAAPEMIAGQPVTTAADIYSLGVILRKMCDNEPALHPVIDKTLAQDPAGRYLSATELAADLDRWRNGFPVQARKWGMAYRGKLFVLRHRWLVSAATASFLIIAASSGAALWQARRANEALALARVEQRRAEEAARQAEASRKTAVSEHAASANRLQRLVTMASTTLTDIHDTLERIPGSTAERRKIVDETLKLLEKEQAEGANSPQLLETVAEGYRRTATVLGVPTHPNLGDPKTAMIYLDKAIALTESLMKSNPDSPSLWKILLSSKSLASVILEERGSGPEAHRLLVPVIEAGRNWTNRHRDALDVIHALADAQQDDFSALFKTGGEGKLTAAPILAALENLNYVLARRPNDRNVLKDLASAHSHYSEYQVMRADMAGAVTTLLKAAAIREQLSRQAPDDTVVLRDLMISYSKLGDVFGSPVAGGAHLGDPEKAYFYGRKMIAIADKIAALDPNDRNARFDVAMAVLHAGMIEPQPAQVGESIQFLNSAVERLQPLLSGGQGPQNYAYLANAHEFLARRHVQRGDPSAAAASARKSLEIVQDANRKNPGNQRLSIQLLYSYLAAIQLAGSYMTEAERTALIAYARSDFASIIQGKERMRHYPARLAAAEGDMQKALGLKGGCTGYQESLRLWLSLPPDKGFTQEIEGVRRKAANCRSEISNANPASARAAVDGSGT